MSNIEKDVKWLNTEREKWLLLIVLSIIWGSSFILIKKSLTIYNPYEVEFTAIFRVICIE
jgi:drug/metabolite transporter (DMT)-like permease